MRGGDRADTRGAHTYQLSASRPLDQQLPELAKELVLLGLERLRRSTTRPRAARSCLTAPRRPDFTPQGWPFTSATTTPVRRLPEGKRDPERRAGHGPSTGSRAAVIAPNPAPTFALPGRS